MTNAEVEKYLLSRKFKRNWFHFDQNPNEDGIFLIEKMGRWQVARSDRGYHTVMAEFLDRDDAVEYFIVKVEKYFSAFI